MLREVTPDIGNTDVQPREAAGLRV